MTDNPAHKLMKRIQENRKSLNIARVPDKTKEDFVNLANEEFVGDYGLTLKWCLDQALEYQVMKQTFFQRLDQIFDNISQTEKTEEKPENFIKMLDGTKRHKGGEKDG